MVTLEPWTAPAAGGHKSTDLFSDIQDGYYDSIIDRVCGDLGTLGIPLFIRWGHEMEAVMGRYPWAQHDPTGYIAAYRHFVDRCRPLAEPSFFVWSPKGNENMPQYYPGADQVDYIGLSLFSLERFDSDNRARPLYFEERFQETYSYVADYNKPIMIAELGIQGEASYVSKWIKQLADARRQFPLLRVVSYFNAREVDPWPAPYGTPDWRIEPTIFPPGLEEP